MIGGGLEVEEGVAKIMVDSVSPMEDILKKTKRMVFRLDRVPHEDYPRLQSLMKDHPGPTAVSLEIDIPDVSRRVMMEMSTGSGVAVNNEFFEGVHSIFGRTDFIELR